MERKFWVLLRDEDFERMLFMKNMEKRSYASLIRMALAEYYLNHYSEHLELELINTA